MKTHHFILLLCCIMSFFMTGCGNTPSEKEKRELPFSNFFQEKPSAADSVKAIYNLHIYGDTSGASRLGISNKDISNALNAYDTTLKNAIRSNFSASGLEIDEETVVHIYEARKDALSKMNAEFTVTSEENSTAVVTVSTTYFDEVTLDQDAAYNAREQADAQDFTDYDAYLKFIMKTYTQNLIESYQNVIPSKDKKEIIVPCIIINNTWLPENMADFGNELSLTVAGQR